MNIRCFHKRDGEEVEYYFYFELNRYGFRDNSYFFKPVHRSDWVRDPIGKSFFKIKNYKIL